MTFFDHYLYLVTNAESIAIVDLHALQQPAILGNVVLPTKITSMVREGHYLYFLAEYEGSGFAILDLTDRAQPQMVGMALTQGKAKSLAVVADKLFVSTTYGIEMFPLLPSN
jgi:hypothetical protein